MATETASGQYKGTLTEDGTVTVTGRGKCYVKTDGNFGGGTLTLLDNATGSYTEITEDGTDVTFTADGSKLLEYPETVSVGVRASLAGSTSPSLGLAILFSELSK